MDAIAIAAAIQELQNEVQRQRDEIIHLKDVTPPLASTPTPSSKPKPSLPHPEKFSGQTYKWDTWLPSIKAKLLVDGEAIGNDVAQFYYVYLNLESTVQAMVLPQLAQASDSNIHNYNDILDQLARVYDNPNKVQEAEDKLAITKQGTDSLQVYLAKFERTLYEARAQDWPDVNKISYFRNGLNEVIRNRLRQQLNLPRNYSDYIRTVQQLAGRSGSAPSANNLMNPHSFNNRSSNGKDPQAMDMSNIIADISGITFDPIKAPSISSIDRDILRQQGKCVRCGEDGHWIKDCDKVPHKKIIKRGQFTQKEKNAYITAANTTINTITNGTDSGGEGYEWDSDDSAFEQERRLRSLGY